jgi:cell division protein FtsA
MDLPFPRAEEMKLDYARGLLVDRRPDVARIVAEDVSIWGAGVELVLDELAAGDLLPGRVYLCGGGSHLPEIETTLRGEEFWKHLPFSRPPEVAVITPKQVERIKDGTNLLVDQQDVTPLGLAYQAIELQTNEDPLDIALRRVLKAMKI